MGQFAASIKTLFGGGAGPPLERPNLLRTLGVGGVGGAAATVVPQVVSGNIANPENWASPAAIAGLATGLGAAGARYAGQAYQQSRPFANALINAGGAAIANPLSRYMPAIGTQAFPQRGAQK
jgi:hypothetical protein